MLHDKIPEDKNKRWPNTSLKRFVFSCFVIENTESTYHKLRRSFSESGGYCWKSSVSSAFSLV